MDTDNFEFKDLFFYNVNASTDEHLTYLGLNLRSYLLELSYILENYFLKLKYPAILFLLVIIIHHH